MTSALSTIDPQFIISRSGRPAVLYAGLLDAAHKIGLKSVHTTLLQAPAEGNGYTAICHARTEFEGGRVFEDIGDANAGNVGKAIVPHIIRMAATRAKARCLRDALNINGVAVEELGDERDDADPPVASPQPIRPVQPAGPDQAQVAAAIQEATRLWALLGKPGDMPPFKPAAAAIAAVAELRAEADKTPASEQQWARYVDALGKLANAGHDVGEPLETMTVSEYERAIMHLNGLRRQPAAARRSS